MKIKFIQKIIDKIRKKKTPSNIITKGINNKIFFKNDKNVFMSIYGNNNEITVEAEGNFVANIIIGTPDCETNNCKVHIAPKVTSNGVQIMLLEDDSYLEIGEDSMLSNDIKIFCSDTHSITDSEGNLLNYAKGVKIGKHVWIGTDTDICKNVHIANNCIIGMGSVVTKSFDEEGCIIAGNPAKIVKRNINWDRKRPKQYIAQIKK